MSAGAPAPAALPAPPPPASPPPPGAPARDRWIDLLRVVALGRVMTYHVLPWAWLPFAFPSMGVMFALAGSLVAASLTRSPHDHYRVIGRRLRRLLPPVWVLGLVLVPAMLLAGWQSQEPGEPLSAPRLLLWLVPVGTPPHDALGAEWVEPLWYVRSYLWFVVASPALLWLFRRWPRRTLAVFPATVALHAAGVLDLEGRSGAAVLDAGVYGACWLVGFAHHDGVLARTRWRSLLPLAGALALAGAVGALHPAAGGGQPLEAVPAANALYSLGFALVVLRLRPSTAWIARRRLLDGFVGAVNTRAVTIYLWGNVAIWAASPVLALSPLAPWYTPDARGSALQLATSWVLVAVAVLCFGWAEDLAARRAPQLVPRAAGARAGAGGRLRG